MSCPCQKDDAKAAVPEGLRTDAGQAAVVLANPVDDSPAVVGIHAEGPHPELLVAAVDQRHEVRGVRADLVEHHLLAAEGVELGRQEEVVAAGVLASQPVVEANALGQGEQGGFGADQNTWAVALYGADDLARGLLGRVAPAFQLLDALQATLLVGDARLA